MNNNEVYRIEINENLKKLSGSKVDKFNYKVELFIEELKFDSEILDLNKFPNLTSLNLSESKIKEIIIPKNNIIKELYIINNNELEI